MSSTCNNMTCINKCVEWPQFTSSNQGIISGLKGNDSGKLLSKRVLRIINWAAIHIQMNKVRIR